MRQVASIAARSAARLSGRSTRGSGRGPSRPATLAAMHALTPGTARPACVFSGHQSGKIACGAVVPVTSRGPRDGLWEALKDAGLTTLRRIGDARAPGLIAHAVRDGHRAGRARLAPGAELILRRERVVLA